MAKENEIVLFETEDEKVKLSVPIQDETVWLTQDQMSELFDTARSSIAYHIGNIFKEKELERDTSVEIFDRSKNSSRPPQYYNLDVIISVGYRVKSQRGIEFRRWAKSLLSKAKSLVELAIDEGENIAIDLMLNLAPIWNDLSFRSIS